MNEESQQNPYAPPQANVSDFKESTETVEPASRGIRFGAAVLDSVVFFITCLPILISVGFDPYAMIDASAYADIAGMATVGLIIVLLVVTVVLVHRSGQTIGKNLVSIKVVRSDGSRASLGRIFWLRNVVNWIPSVIPIVGNFYGIIDHLFIFGAKRQCLHDKIADTIVINA